MVTIRPREDWQNPSQPVVGPTMVLATVDLVPSHYTAASTIPDDIPQYLRNIQNDYTVNRGYSIGYNFAVDQTGTAWELRGFDIKSAANKGMNEVTIAVLCLVDGADAMSPVMVDTFNELAAEAQRVCGRELLVVGHRDIGSTTCPGDGIYHQVVTGQLDPTPEPEPEPEPVPEEPDMTQEQYDALMSAVNATFVLVEQLHPKVDARALEQSVQDTFHTTQELHPKVDHITQLVED